MNTQVTTQNEITVGRRTLQVVKTTDARLNVSWTLVEADGTEWVIVDSPRRSGQGCFRGDRVAVNRATGKRLQRNGKVVRFYAHNGLLNLGL